MLGMQSRTCLPASPPPGASGRADRGQVDNCILLPVCVAVETVLRRRLRRILFNLGRPCSAGGGRLVHNKPLAFSPPEFPRAQLCPGEKLSPFKNVGGGPLPC